MGWRADLTVYMPVYADVELLKQSLRNYYLFPNDTQFIFVLDRVNGYTEKVIRSFLEGKNLKIFRTFIEPGDHDYKNHLNFLIRSVDYYFRYSDYILFTQADVILDIDTILNNYSKNDVVCYNQRLGLRWDIPRKIHKILKGKMFSGVFTIKSDLYYEIRPELYEEYPFEYKVSKLTKWIGVESNTINLRPYTKDGLYRLGRYRRKLGYSFWRQFIWSLIYLDINSLKGWLDG